LLAAAAISIARGMRLRSLVAVLLLSICLAAPPAAALDPPYQDEMERLAELMGSLYFLQPLCQPGLEDWRAQMAELIALDEPDEDRRQRLAGAFNAGYGAYARLYRICTLSASEALTRLLVEAEAIAREIHSRFAE
jgi:uncharacterized protein (TIGR02301 family)